MTYNFSKLATAVFVCFSTLLVAQTSPEVKEIWQKIEQNHFEIAVKELTDLVKKQPTHQEALASLVLLGDVLPDSKPFEKYFAKLASLPDADPAVVFALLPAAAGLNEGLLQSGWDRTNAQALILNDKSHPTNRAYGLAYLSYDLRKRWKLDSSLYYKKELRVLENWSFLGQFEDEMNSAYDKPSEALIHHTAEH